MAKLLKKAKSEVQQGTIKPNMLKKFAGKLKKAFSKKDHFPVQKPKKPCVEDVLPAITALPTSILREVDKASELKIRSTTPTHVGIDEEFESSATTSRELVATTSWNYAAPSLGLVSQDVALPKTSMEPAPSTPQNLTKSSGTSGSSVSSSEYKFDSDRNRVLRSNTSPPSPSSPTTAASSETLFNTPRHSNESSPSSLAKFRQVLDEHTGSKRVCHKALIEYLKGEEAEKENTEWTAVVEWIKIGHQAEVTKLEKNHAAKIENLRQERSKERRCLELRNREVRAVRREMKELKKNIENTTEDQDEIQPTSNSQSADESDAESVDEEEGGVALAAISVPSDNVESVRVEVTDGVVQEVGEAEHGMRIDDEGTNEATTSKKETAEEKKKLQQELKKQLMEDSIPEALLEAEAGYPAAIGDPQVESSSRNAVASKGPNTAPFTDLNNLQAHNKALQNNLAFTREVIHNMQTEAESREAELQELQNQNHFAQLEISHLHAINAEYRSILEDNDNPARTAHLDGLLKRKDESITHLETRAAECAEQLEAEKKARAIDNAYSDSQAQGLKNELAHRLNTIAALSAGRDILRRQNDSVHAMLRGRITTSDALAAFHQDYDALERDHARLSQIAKERKCYVLDAENKVAKIKAEIMKVEHAAQAEVREHRDTRRRLNGLVAVNGELEAKLDIRAEIRDEEVEHLESRLQVQSAEFEALRQGGADQVLGVRNRELEGRVGALVEEVGGRVL